MKNSLKDRRFVINLIICIVTIVGLLAIDIITKLVVYYHFDGKEGANIVVIKDFFWIYLTFNRGALAGFLADTSFGRVLLAIISVIGTIVSMYFLVKKFNKLPILYRIALYLFIPGCAGNLIDRVGIYGTPGVIDFLRFRLFGFYDFPVFNFADMCLTCSIIMFAIAIIFTKDKDKEQVTNEVEEDILKQKEKENEVSSN